MSKQEIARRCTAFAGAVLIALAAGCGKKDDAVSQGATQNALAGKAVPKHRRGEGHRGRRLHLWPAAGDELRRASTTSSSTRSPAEYKAPYNQIHNEHRVFTYEDTTVDHAQQRHAVLGCLASTCGPSRS